MAQEWLPDIVAANFRRMDAEGLLDERERAFFTDSKLKEFWKKVDSYLSCVQADYRSNAAEQLVAGFLSPLQYGYDKTGKASNRTLKNNIREAQKKNADLVIARIARLAGELANALDELEDTARFHPDGTELLPIVKQLIDEEALKGLPSYYGRVRTSDALRILEKSFSEYPEAGELFKDVPGMASQKSSWVDWMREAEANIQETLGIWPGELQLKKIDWVNLVPVLIRGVSEAAVRKALAEGKQHD